MQSDIPLLVVGLVMIALFCMELWSMFGDIPDDREEPQDDDDDRL